MVKKSPAQDVRPYQLLDGIEHARVADQVIQPLEQEESAASLHRLEFSALGRLIRFELPAQSQRLLGRHDRHRANVAVAPVLRDLLGREQHRNTLLEEPHASDQELLFHPQHPTMRLRQKASSLLRVKSFSARRDSNSDLLVHRAP